MAAEVVAGVADVANTTLDDIETAPSGIMFVDRSTMEFLKTAGITAKIAVLTPAHAGTPNEKVTRVPARMKSGEMEIRRCEVHNLGTSEEQVKLTPFMQVRVVGQAGIPVPCII